MGLKLVTILYNCSSNLEVFMHCGAVARAYHWHHGRRQNRSCFVYQSSRRGRRGRSLTFQERNVDIHGEKGETKRARNSSFVPFHGSSVFFFQSQALYRKDLFN